MKLSVELALADTYKKYGTSKVYLEKTVRLIGTVGCSSTILFQVPKVAKRSSLCLRDNSSL